MDNEKMNLLYHAKCFQKVLDLWLISHYSNNINHTEVEMKEKRGGPGRGQGRKPVKAGEETVTVSIRMTQAQREKLERIGGAKWVRYRIDRAKEHNVGLGSAKGEK